MYEKILTALKLKFAGFGVSDKVLERIATKKAQTITDETLIDSVVAELTGDMLISSETDSRTVDSNRKAVENYEKKHGIKDGKVIEKDQTPEKVEIPNDAPEYVKLLQQQVGELKSLLTGFVGDTTKKTHVEAVKAELLKQGVRPEYIDNITIDANSPEEVPAAVTKAKEGYDNFIQKAVEDKVFTFTPKTPTPDNGGEPKTPTIGNFLDAEFPK